MVSKEFLNTFAYKNAIDDTYRPMKDKKQKVMTM